MNRARWRAENGASAVEFALVLPILLILLFGIITGGMLYNQQLSVTQAAREGARFAATYPYEGNEGDWELAVRQRTEDVFDANHPDQEITVVEPNSDGMLAVRVERPGRLEIIFNAWEPTLSAESTARHETYGGDD